MDVGPVEWLPYAIPTRILCNNTLFSKDTNMVTVEGSPVSRTSATDANTRRAEIADKPADTSAKKGRPPDAIAAYATALERVKTLEVALTEARASLVPLRDAAKKAATEEAARLQARMATVNDLLGEG